MSTNEPYPTERITYNKTIGDLRVNNIALVVRQELGFVVQTYPIESNGIDISFHYTNGEMLAALEVTNWRRTSFFDIDRRRRIINNLRQYPCTRLLVVSFIDNIQNPKDFVRELADNNIRIIDLGFQTQPKTYDNWFQWNQPLVWIDSRTPEEPLVRSTIRNKFSFLPEQT